MKYFLVLVLLFSWTANAQPSEHQVTLDKCIAGWKDSPFKKGHHEDKIISTGVKIMGIGKGDVSDDEHTKTPSLVLVKPTVNVMAKTTLRLMNPNGWYCLKSNVAVLGKLEIQVDCKAHLAASGDGGTAVLASNESGKGVAVLGSLRVKRVNCK